MILQWIKLHCNLLTHPKTFKLQKLLDLPDLQEAFKIVGTLWMWVALHAPEGNLRDDEFEAAFSAMGVNWKGPVETLRNALVEAGWIDPPQNGVYALHNWKERTASFQDAQERFERTKELNRVRQQKHYEKVKAEQRLREELKSRYGTERPKRGLRKSRKATELPVLPPEKTTLKKDPENPPTLEDLTHDLTLANVSLTLGEKKPTLGTFTPPLIGAQKTGEKTAESVENEKSVNYIKNLTVPNVSLTLAHAHKIRLESKDLKTAEIAKSAIVGSPKVSHSQPGKPTKEGTLAALFKEKLVRATKNPPTDRAFRLFLVERELRKLLWNEETKAPRYAPEVIGRRIDNWFASTWDKVAGVNWRFSEFLHYFDRLAEGPLAPFKNAPKEKKHGQYDKRPDQFETRNDFE